MKRFVVAAALAAISVPGLALAQQAETISVGRTVSGALGSGDFRAGDDTFYDHYKIRLSDGQRITVRMRSSDVDAFLAVLELDGEQLDTDDDGGEGTDARLTFTAPRAGEFLIRANTLAAGETGDYRLSVEAAGAVTRAPTPRVIAVGQTVTGTIDASDPKADDDTPYEGWGIRLSAGQRIVIAMKSSDFDAYIAVIGPNGEDLKTDDDGGEGNDARMVFTAAKAGTHVIRANTIGEDDTGRYTLSVATAPPSPTPPAPRPIAIGQTVSGTIDPRDPLAEDDTPYEAWRVTLTRGQTVTIRMKSTEVDSYIAVMGPGGDQLETDDDGGEGNDARLIFTAPTSDTYVVRANTISGSERGAYTLSLAAGAPR